MPSPAPKGGKTRGGAAKPARVGKLVTAAVQKATKPPKPRKPPAPPVSRNNNLPEFTVKIKRDASYKRGPFDRKMRALKKLSDEGKLFKQANPVKRNSDLTKGYKNRVRQKIFDKYWQPDSPESDKKFARKLVERLDKLDPDHVWELQLGGDDTASNLRLLDSHTNQHVGRKIWEQIRSLPDGTPIRIEVVD